MNEINFEQNLKRENQVEGEPKHPEVSVYFYRHAEALGQGKDLDITEKGIEQAREAGELFYNQIKERGGMVKFLSSPIKRCVQTAKIMEDRLRELSDQDESSKTNILQPRVRSKVGLPGIAPTLRQMGHDTDMIEYWLTHPDVVPGKTPLEISKKIENILRIIQKVANRLKEGTNVTYVYISHEPYTAAFMNQLTGKTLSELGGDIGNCEAMKIEVEGRSDKPAEVSFRGLNKEIDLGNKPKGSI